MRHRIDPLIAERAGWLYSARPFVNIARRIAERILDYDETLRVAEQVRDHDTAQIMNAMAARLARRIEIRGIQHLPANGAALIVANHPTGIADGIFLYHVLARVRPDLFFYANSDILRVLPQMADIIVPVEWRKDRRSHAKTRETMRQTAQALKDGRLGVIFPSGRLAKRRGLRLVEREWMPSAAMIARKFDAPIIPVHIQARNSALFYLFDLIHPTLRDITLFHETLNKDRQPYRIRIGVPISPRSLPANSPEAIAVLRRETLELAGPDARNVSLLRTSRLLYDLV